MNKYFHTDGLVRDVVLMHEGERVTPQSVAVTIIGGTMGESAAREGVTEAARRLSHALAELAAVLDTEFASAAQCKSARGVLAEKAKGALREWGVA